ncbi:hypothetical protein ASPBRDRAFT_51405 [Aspergillus brasiliensis CBS 101740]|uniref:Uncharacterized protein n=1 Tax=Aspergillus brasiliensis (strain CBS 101740 / IMI 381727 / IBT 21946) TaxID=767769 RepID=A0A1L9UVG7_ASPBC|nr:hypothetical protein ASPBRDRAFT_51405 [Aspergillus brasiliensis CBS 101740]
MEYGCRWHLTEGVLEVLRPNSAISALTAREAVSPKSNREDSDKGIIPTGSDHVSASLRYCIKTNIPTYCTPETPVIGESR